MSNHVGPPPPNKEVVKEFTGALLVSEEELTAAAETDPFLLKLRDYVAHDEAYLANLKEELREAQKTAKRLKAYEQRIVVRLKSRQREIKHFTKLLRKRLAWQKIKETREQIGL